MSTHSLMSGKMMQTAAKFRKGSVRGVSDTRIWRITAMSAQKNWTKTQPAMT